MRFSGQSTPSVKMPQARKGKAVCWTSAGVAVCFSGFCLPDAQAQGDTAYDSAQVPVIGSAAIAPLNSGPASLPSSAPRVIAAPSLISLNFEDAKASTILGIISEQGKVNIMIGGGVTGTVAKVLLNDVTPEIAIQRVAMAAELVYKKLDDNTYFIGKTLPPELAAPAQPISIPPSGMMPDGRYVMNVAPNINSLNLPPLINTSADSAQNSPKSTRVLRVKYVAASIMAFWVDPQHQPKPVEFVQSEKNAKSFTNTSFGTTALDPNIEAMLNQSTRGGSLNSSNDDNSSQDANGFDGGNGLGQFSTPDAGAYTEGNAQRRGRGRGGGGAGGFGGGGGGGGGGFDLPEGVDRLIAIEPQNALLVYGTTEGVNRLQEIVSLLDQPLRQVEIEAQFVTVQSSDISSLGITFSGSNGTFTVNNTTQMGLPADLSIGFVRGNFQARLSALALNNKVKIVNSPRVTAINNLTATLTSTQSTPVNLPTQIVSGGNPPVVSTGTRLIYINTSIGLTVRPTINNDDTITVVMQPQVTSQDNTSGGAPAISQQLVQTVANVRDGDTIALGGLRSKRIIRNRQGIPVLRNIPILGQFFRQTTNNDADSDLIIFVTARIIRRAEDPVAGTFVSPQ